MRLLLRDAGLLFVAILAVLLGGLFLGGVLETGQADPLRWVGALGAAVLVVVVVALWEKRRPVWVLPVLAGSGGVGAVLIFCLVAGVGTAFEPLLFRGGVGGGASPDSASLGAKPHPNPSPEGEGLNRPSLAIMSALPLFRRPDASVADTLHGPATEAPAITLLSRAFAVRPVDRLNEGALQPGDRLLLAQPRLLRPEELVALDAWVRAGGRAVILADPLLLWPLDLPLGDRRRPPATSLLDPLLAHWGLTLMPAAPGREAVERRLLAHGEMIPMAGASHFRAQGQECRTIEQGLVALCRIGRGQVRLIADADLLNDRLWLARADALDDHAALTGDSMAYLRRAFMAPLDESPGVPAHRWIRDDAALLAGVRWAMLFGTIWAGLGGWLLWRREKPGRDGKIGNEAVDMKNKHGTGRAPPD